jgi:hypothetical protein
MDKFTILEAVAVPFDQADIDTNQLCPTRFNKVEKGPKYAEVLFHDLRFNPDGSEKAEFILNQPRYRQAGIIVADRNFGCGSSRESADLRHQVDRRAKFRRYFFQQLLQEQRAAGRARRFRLRRDAPPSPCQAGRAHPGRSRTPDRHRPRWPAARFHGPPAAPPLPPRRPLYFSPPNLRMQFDPFEAAYRREFSWLGRDDASADA